MATQYRYSFGPWNLSEGADPFGPDVRPPRPFSETLEIAQRLGFHGLQFHDDEVIPADLPAAQLPKACAEIKQQVRCFIEEIYNEKRRHSSLGYVALSEMEQQPAAAAIA